MVTTIGLLVHVYSIGYMSHDPGYWRFFAYLNLFMFSMLLLVLAGNFLVVFVAWELVGLCSYLLIGFWYRKRSAALAAKKAFIVNRVGDVGFILGIMLIFVSLGTLDIREVIERIGELDATTITLIALLIFAGAMGKSAQFPLHVWLPDAMEGPTPVSALIHAATMVNAGVYLVARTNPIFASRPVRAGGGRRDRHLHRDPGGLDRDDPDRHQARPGLLDAQPARLHVRRARGRGLDGGDLPPDDPRLLQGPPLPRLGLGHPRRPRGTGHAPDGRPGAEDPDHLRDDAHRLAGDRRDPAAGRLLLEGRDPRRVVKLGFVWVWAIGFIVAGLTAFYMFRLMGMTFWGSFRGPKEIWETIHESPPVMTIPLILLAIPSVFLGMFLGLPLGASRIHEWLAPIFEEGEHILQGEGATEPAYQLFGIDGVLIIASVTIATIGMILAWRLFGVELGPLRMPALPERVRELTARAPFLYRASLNKWWFDDLYHLLFMVIGGKIAAAIWWFDREVIDGTVNAIGAGTIDAGRGLRQVQTGRVQNYALGIAIGLIVMAGSYLLLAGR